MGKVKMNTQYLIPPEKKLTEKTADRNKDCISLCVIWLAATVFLLLSSFATSPFYKIRYPGDAAMFLTIGKYWAEGTLPYVGLWDSKGPIIFAINALGYWMLGSKQGVFVLQNLSLFAAMLFVYKIFRKRSTALGSLVGSLAVLWILLTDYAGDGTEEFVLPLLCGSFYLMYCWTTKISGGENAVHSPWAAFLYGLTFAFCFLTRLTNALGICAGTLVIAVVLLVHKEFKNLIWNAAAFLAGAAVLIAPFAVYFQSKGILYDAFYGTFLYNLDYLGKSNTDFSGMQFGELWWLLAGYSGAVALTFSGLMEILFSRAKRTAGVLWTVVGLITAAWLFHSYGFLHYGAIALPYFAVAFEELWNLKPTRRQLNWLMKAAACGFLLFAILGSVKTFRGLREDYSGWMAKTAVEMQTDEKILEDIPEAEKDSFIAYNTESDLYLQTGIKPCYPYFTMQDWAASQSTLLTEMLVDRYANGTATWILVRGTPETTLIHDTLKNRYHPVRTEKDYTLYRIN